MEDGIPFCNLCQQFVDNAKQMELISVLIEDETDCIQALATQDMVKIARSNRLVNFGISFFEVYNQVFLLYVAIQN
jgi:hypothetical protein